MSRYERNLPHLRITPAFRVSIPLEEPYLELVPEPQEGDAVLGGNIPQPQPEDAVLGGQNDNLLIQISLEEAILNRQQKPEISECFCHEFGYEFDCGEFVCASCQFITPWCRGAGDKYWEDCDACAVLKFEMEEGNEIISG